MASCVSLISQWGRPSSDVATASIVGILLGVLIFVAGCLWLLYKSFTMMRFRR
jgi:preprotein translocase subunit SecF